MNLDLIIFVGFLIINLGVGLYKGKRVKTIEDYALGGRNFSTLALVCTIVATFTSGSAFTIGLQHTYSDGLYDIIPTLGMGVQIFLVGIILVPRMVEFLGKLSVASAVGSIYGNQIRLIVAIFSLFKCIGFTAIQLKVFGGIFHYFFSNL